MGPWNPAVIGPIAGAVMVVALTAGIAGVLIFRPLTRQLGELLDQMRRDRRQAAERAGTDRLSELMEGLLDRVERLEARQEFTERVMESAGWKGEASGAIAHRSNRERGDRAGDS